MPRYRPEPAVRCNYHRARAIIRALLLFPNSRSFLSIALPRQRGGGGRGLRWRGCEGSHLEVRVAGGPRRRGARNSRRHVRGRAFASGNKRGLGLGKIAEHRTPVNGGRDVGDEEVVVVCVCVGGAEGREEERTEPLHRGNSARALYLIRSAPLTALLPSALPLRCCVVALLCCCCRWWLASG
jgi:hypothetical protein